MPGPSTKIAAGEGVPAEGRVPSLVKEQLTKSTTKNSQDDSA